MFIAKSHYETYLVSDIINQNHTFRDLQGKLQENFILSKSN